MKKHLNVVLTLSVLAGSMILASGCTSSPTSAAQSTVPSVKVITINSSNAVGASGKLATDQTVQVVSKIGGKIASVSVEEGAKVKKGDLLVQLDTEDLLQQLDQAQAGLTASQAKLADTEAGARSQDVQAATSAVEQAKAAVNQAKAGVSQAQAAFDLVTKNYNHAKNFYDQGDVSSDELDKVTLDYEKAKSANDSAISQQQAANAQLSAAEAKLGLVREGATANTLEQLKADVTAKQAALNLVQIAIKNAGVVSPIDGVIVKKNVNAGEMAQAGAALLTVVNMDKVKVEVSVPEGMINSIKQGAKGTVIVPSIPGKTFEGTISFVSPVSDTNNNTFPVKLTVNNPDGTLHAGAVASVAFGDSSNESRIEVPKVALIQKDGKSVAFKLSGDAVQSVVLQTEDKNQDWVYLKGDSALKPGDKIVLNPGDKLTDGAKVHAE
ncbi:efflux RND transporter periplasmic adaptor subunit [Paenibacillus aceris]|uniref:Multidrug efflux pump subunit AcrA (Membrane-fusion protein) n=1 Tax=Paenibacillus aceris TaxID=869555 RepID=A0ABS4I396_9BACL|nr:efflux RND transporter periplasmic adaptor subunit [Paenibacillus aceris]MBP1965407.1 multidrug efflux pump subunit AcrA (membrane-fusion protein) [Paenibacillus aceris]NHW33542.1 efflux RND transporter periplasmic adaptor subunit [Paenibacillus aceris]